MKALYNFTIVIANFLLKIIGFFNPKIKKGVVGRAESFELLSYNLVPNKKRIWLHCASLGEYEQGLPLFKKLRQSYNQHQIFLTFFSPSGYEIRKNTEIADLVLYLPLDTKSNAKKFVEMLQPQLTVFVKYEIWPNYLLELQKRHLPTLLISATFRKEQLYFQSYGALMRNALKTFDHIFVQDENSKILLHSLHFNNVTVAGDTRYDRVSDQLKLDNNLPFIEEFIDGELCVVVGSSWPEDELLFQNYINHNFNNNVKFIIAPHNIKSSQIHQFKNQLQEKTILFSEKEGKNLSDYKILIIDTIGILSKIYSYASIAYVGGAMGNTGLHNILEPAVFGIPVIIGKNYKKFPEATEMIANGGVFSIKDGQELETLLNELLENSENRNHYGQLNGTYIKDHQGAVGRISKYLNI